MTQLDLTALLIFGFSYLAYHALYFLLPRTTRLRTRESHIQAFRRAWLLNIQRRDEPILIIQTLRNLIMVHTYLGSLSLLAVGGLFSYFFANVDLVKVLEAHGLPAFLAAHAIVIKLLAAQLVLLFSFLNALFGLRVCFNLNFTLSAPKDMGGNLEFQLESLNRQAWHMILSTRSLYFAAPLLLWPLSPWLMILGAMCVVLLLAHFDFRHALPDPPGANRTA